MYDEDSGETIVCPYCGEESCRHQVAVVDVTFSEIAGGMLFGNKKVGQPLRHLEDLFCRGLSQLAEGSELKLYRLEALRIAILEGVEYAADVEEVWLPYLAFLSYLHEVLMSVDGVAEGYGVNDGAPGTSSAYQFYWAMDPASACRNVARLITQDAASLEAVIEHLDDAPGGVVWRDRTLRSAVSEQIQELFLSNPGVVIADVDLERLTGVSRRALIWKLVALYSAEMISLEAVSTDRMKTGPNRPPLRTRRAASASADGPMDADAAERLARALYAATPRSFEIQLIDGDGPQANQAPPILYDPPAGYPRGFWVAVILDHGQPPMVDGDSKKIVIRKDDGSILGSRG